MKKTFVRVLSFALIAVMMVCALASCAKKISGTYVAEVGGELAGYTATYTFSGKKVNVTKEATIAGFSKTTELNGTYEIAENDEGELEITLSFETEDDEIKSGTFTFSEGVENDVEYIKIAGIKYTKKAD